MVQVAAEAQTSLSVSVRVSMRGAGMTAMEHVRYLAETIGPRGSTTAGEAEAARYAAQALQDAGLAPVTERFTSARSAWYPYTLFSGLLLVSELLFWVGGRWGAVAALALALLALVSVLVELAFRPNPLRWALPKGSSQNVWARLQPRCQPLQEVVLMGHLDTHRTPLAFATDRWLLLFRSLVPVGLVSSVVLVILHGIGIASMARLWRLLSLAPGAVALGLLLLTLQADFSSFSPGANDNATGAGIVLSVAERLRTAPLTRTSVWVVLSGCEEVGCYGADAFARAHREELVRASWVVLDTVGSAGAGPTYLTRETFLLSAPSDPGLLALADRVASRHPELGALGRIFQGAYTEGSIGAKYGFRVLTLTSLSAEGSLAQWHRPTDVADSVDPDVVRRSERFLWEFLQEFDRQAGMVHGTERSEL
jgi:hypothetical protein